MLLSASLVRTLKEVCLKCVFTNNWLSTVKRRGIPLDNAGVLSHAEDSDTLRRIWNIWGKTFLTVTKK